MANISFKLMVQIFGTKCVPMYTTLFMRKFEEMHILPSTNIAGTLTTYSLYGSDQK